MPLCGTLMEQSMTENTEAQDRQQELGLLFEQITGTVVFVEQQDQAIDTRYLDDDDAVSTYVTASIGDDGLTDAIGTPDYE